MIEKLKRNIFISLTAAAVIYLLLTIYADYETVLKAFENFDWIFFPVILLLSYLNYLTRFIKWDYYLRLLKVKIKRFDSFQIFMSGLVMSVTPGKFGELLKSYMVKQISGEPISRTAPIVLVERITDFVSLLLIALVGMSVYGIGGLLIIGTSVVFFLLIVILTNKKITKWTLNFLSRFKFLRKYVSNILTAYESANIMLQPSPLFKMTLLSFVSWFFECFGFYLILIKFKVQISVLWASFVYAFSTILGSITMLPGGLGVTDGSLTFLLVDGGISINTAVAATFIIRAATLWFAVLVGIFSLVYYQKRIGKIEINKISIKGEIDG